MGAVGRRHAPVGKGKGVELVHRQGSGLDQAAVPGKGHARHAVQALAPLVPGDDLLEREDALAHDDDVDVGRGKIIGCDRGVMAANDGQHLGIPGLDLAEQAADHVHVNGVGRDAHDVRLRARQGRRQVLVQPLVEHRHVVVPAHAGGHVFERQRFVEKDVLTADGPWRLRRFDQQDLHAILLLPRPRSCRAPGHAARRPSGDAHPACHRCPCNGNGPCSRPRPARRRSRDWTGRPPAGAAPPARAR